MEIYLLGALLLAQAGTSAKQLAMKQCGKNAPGAFNSVCINMARAAICFLVSLPIWLLTGGGATTAAGHLIAIVAGLGTAVNLFTWILASQVVPLVLIECVSIIGTLIVPLILAPYLYDGDTVTAVQWIGGALVLLSVLFFMKRERGEKKSAKPIYKVLVVVLCAVGAMLAAVLKKYYSFHIKAKGLGSLEYFTMIGFAAVLAFCMIMFVVYCLAERRKSGKSTLVLPYGRIWKWILLAAIALYVNELFTSYAKLVTRAL